MKSSGNKRKVSSDSDGETKAVAKANPTKTAKFSHFLSLESSMNDTKLQIYKDDKFVCIRDKYPKSMVHFLLIPLAIKGVKLTKVQDVLKLSNCLEFLGQMRKLADSIIDQHVSNDLKSRVNCGFHAIQSMNPLHMHIISNDFKSDCLKNKKHWNSFNTKYFINLNDLIQHLEVDLKNMSVDYFAKDKFNLNNSKVLKEYMDQELKCNQCNLKLNNMPNLKKHLLTHIK